MFPPEKNSAASRSLVFETWLLDVYSKWNLKTGPQARLLEGKIQQKNKGPDVWRCFAGLKPLWRTAILDHISSRNRGASFEWGLYSFAVLQRGSTLKILRQRDNDQLLQVVLFRQDHSSHENFAEQEGTTNQNNAAWVTPRTVSRSSNLKRIQAQNDILPQQSSTHMQPKVTFASEIDQILKDVPTVRSSRNLRRFRDAGEMKKAIVRLGQTKRNLGPADEDRIDEINDMIILLTAQYKLHRTLSWNQQEDWYHHIEKDLPFGCLEEGYVPKQGAHGPKLRAKTTRRTGSAARNRTGEDVLPHDNRPQYEQGYTLLKDGDLPSAHEIRRELPVPAAASNVIERSTSSR